MPTVDASVVVEWLTPQTDEQLPARQLLDRWQDSSAELVAPRLLFEEALNALLTGVRRGRWSSATADGAASLLGDLPVRITDTPRDRDRAWELARRYDNWPIYDMIYVALAERLGHELVTADHRLLSRLSHLDWVVGPEEVLSRSSGP